MSGEEKKEKEPDLKVTDSRRFTQEGEARGGADADEAKSADKKGTKPLPEIDFPTFILSLATSAQVHLGVIANPSTGKQESDLSLAKQTIDILGVIQEKTKGNLSDDEGRLLEHLLYDLRMMYVEKEK